MNLMTTFARCKRSTSKELQNNDFLKLYIASSLWVQYIFYDTIVIVPTRKDAFYKSLKTNLDLSTLFYLLACE